MNRSANNLTLCEDPHDFLVMQNLYDAAVRQLTLKFNILNSEFNVLYARNPIHHIDGRVKSQSSIVAKLIKRGLPLSIESARKNINDIAGVRVVCSYIDDVYRVGEMLARQTDVEIVKKQDYIQTPNYNGYRSLHMDIKVPVYLSDRTEYVVAEIQLRTIAMDFWASLEHDIRYKVDKTKLPEGINEEIAARRRLRQEESDEDAVARAQKKLDAAKAQLSFARDDYSRAELQKEVTRAQQSLDEAVQSKEDNDWYAAKQAEIDALERQIALAREAAQRDMDSAGQWAKKALAEQEAYQYYYQREQEAAQAAQRTAQVASTAAKVATATLGAISNVTNNNAVKIVTGAAAMTSGQVARLVEKSLEKLSKG